MKEIEFIETIEALCKRPKMYTPTGSFFEVVSFLEGFGEKVDLWDSFSHSVFTPFHKWIIKKYNIKHDIDKDNWKEFRELFSSDSEALENLPSLYKEYVESL